MATYGAEEIISDCAVNTHRADARWYWIEQASARCKWWQLGTLCMVREQHMQIWPPGDQGNRAHAEHFHYSWDVISWDVRVPLLLQLKDWLKTNQENEICEKMMVSLLGKWWWVPDPALLQWGREVRAIPSLISITACTWAFRRNPLKKQFEMTEKLNQRNIKHAGDILLMQKYPSVSVHSFIGPHITDLPDFWF